MRNNKIKITNRKCWSQKLVSLTVMCFVILNINVNLYLLEIKKISNRSFSITNYESKQNKQSSVSFNRAQRDPYKKFIKY